MDVGMNKITTRISKKKKKNDYRMWVNDTTGICGPSRFQKMLKWHTLYMNTHLNVTSQRSN